MGAWSEEPFGNDTAADWGWELDDAESWEFVTEVLRDFLAASDADEDTEAIVVAAAETVAHGLGSPTQDDSYTESVTAFVERVGAPPAETVALARDALRVVRGDGSASAELWAEADDLEAWRDALGRIDAALSR
ncbi:DUF4259 domain-containing protein [Microbacterium sp.]|uniref:DUF4259 domain-containing protein n=1 Tax=Microbacterium sp. TaxID=51671 RepID=UPI0039E23BF7